MDALLDEVESLEAILMDDVQITKNSSGFPELIETTVFPTVGEELDSQYVCITLQVMPPVGYPEVRPSIKLKNPRGLDDRIIGTIERAVQQKLSEAAGQPVVFDLIDLIREQLTESNLPSGQCVICLYGFLEGDEFTKTVCYHYLHSHCLACHINASRRNYDEELAKLPIWKQKETKPFQAQCPVCRESIEVDVEPLMSCRPPTERENAPRFQLTDELKKLQERMNLLYMHQMRRGGIINPDAEESHVIAIRTEPETPEVGKNTNEISSMTAGVTESQPPSRNVSGHVNHHGAGSKKHANVQQHHQQQQPHSKGPSGSKGGAQQNGRQNRNVSVGGPAGAKNALANSDANEDPDACSDPACSGGQNDYQRGGGHRNRRHNNQHHNRHHQRNHHHHHHHQHHQGRGASGPGTPGAAGAGGGGGGAAASSSAGGAAKNLTSPCASDAR